MKAGVIVVDDIETSAPSGGAALRIAPAMVTAAADGDSVVPEMTIEGAIVVLASVVAGQIVAVNVLLPIKVVVVIGIGEACGLDDGMVVATCSAGAFGKGSEFG